eukprot:scaffold273_cov242-Pinguiococcus_pyrenoidosus.AAC.42
MAQKNMYRQTHASGAAMRFQVSYQNLSRSSKRRFAAKLKKTVIAAADPGSSLVGGALASRGFALALDEPRTPISCSTTSAKIPKARPRKT